MKPYPEYKDSGVEWIGKIPQNWILSKYKYFYQSSMGQTILKEDLVDDGDTPVFSATENEVIFGYINNPNVVLEKGDIVIPARGNSIGHVKLVKNRSTCTQTTIYSKKSDSTRCLDNYVFYYLKGLKDFLFQFDRTAIPQITVSQVSENFLTLPPFSEQKAIADFLDKKTALIDGLIEKKKRQIELLKEQRQAVINQAVTQGLDPTVEMKDSGIEWLGEIPKHWDVKKTKLLCSQIGDGIHTTPKYVDTSNIYFINGNNLIDGQIQIQESTKCVDEDEYLKHKIELKKGTILLSINGTIGNQAFYNGEEVILGKSAAYMECEDELDNCFFSYVLKTHYIYNFFEQSLSGTTIKNLSLYTLNNTPVVLPNNEEQKEIVEHLNCAVREINLTISKAEKQIELLQEYRTALISEAVTGKIDVRNAV